MKLSEMRAKHPIDYRLEVQPEGDKAVVYLHGDIVDEEPVDWLTGEPLEGTFITPKGVREALGSIEVNNIDIHLSSYGGSAFASTAIHNYIKSLGKNITVYIDAIAASGGSIIAMSGTNIKMYPNSMLMIHRALTYVYGNAEDLERKVQVLKKLDESVRQNYLDRFTGTEEELIKMIDDETFLTADEAFSVGLCDEVIREEKEEPIQNKFEKKPDMLAAFINAAFINSIKERETK